MTQPKIELRPAHTWDCEDCGRENFCRGVVYEPSPEDQAEFEEETGQPFEMGHWMTAPEAVTCAHCGATFQTEDMRTE